MNDHIGLPRIDASLTVYQIVCESDPQSAVTAEEVRRHVDGVVNDPESVLDLLVAYGLLDRSTDGYTIRCGPTEDVSQWRDRGARRAEALYEAVHGRLGTDVSPSSAGDADPRYAVVEVEADTSLSAVLDRIEAASPDEHAGVVLTTPAEAATTVQRLVDDIEDSDRSTLEMVDTEVVDTDSGLQYRSYLDPS